MKEKADRNAKLDISCSNCSHEFDKALGWLQENDEFSCPNDCGFLFKSKDIVENADDSLKEAANFLSKSIKASRKNLKF